MLIEKSRDAIALDRASARALDQDGHLNVTGCRISKATVNGYYGREIPGADALGLDAGRIYQVLRPVEALEAAAPTFEGKPLLDEHRPVSADDHAPDKVVGAIRNVRFEAPFLVADLSIWDGDAIRDIQSGSKKELSCGYRYTPVQEPGAFDGRPYDLRMADIAGNHLALVHEGRAGPECVVGDAKPIGTIYMKSDRALTRRAVAAQGALTAYLQPKIATDAKIDLSPVISKIGASFDPAAVTKAVEAAVAGKLAEDAAISDLSAILSTVAALALDEDKDDEDDKEKKAEDEEDDKDDKDKDKNKKAQDKAKDEDSDDDDKDDDKDKVTKSAMDAAIKSAVKVAAKSAEDAAVKRHVAIRDAERFVRPWVGDLAMAHDSAEGVYRSALKTLGVKTAGVHPDALRPILEAQPKPGEQARRSAPAHAMDASTRDEYAAMFPNAGRLLS